MNLFLQVHFFGRVSYLWAWNWIVLLTLTFSYSDALITGFCFETRSFSFFRNDEINDLSFWTSWRIAMMKWVGFELVISNQIFNYPWKSIWVASLSSNFSPLPTHKSSPKKPSKEFKVTTNRIWLKKYVWKSSSNKNRRWCDMMMLIPKWQKHMFSWNLKNSMHQ